ncbi:uncharacterized protein DDB_G0290587-like isoform X2 [Macrobrachium nipponense]|uniref:uncharacterized protein DDB_G0290587-like isoform X2 n=1 Tax=Macrobrachium nipponense TaxID=159736 RepID=UPI0030C8AFCB
MIAKLNSVRLTLVLDVMLVIAVRQAYGETGTCPSANAVIEETTFVSGIKLDLYLSNKHPSMFELSFTGGEFRGQGFCFTWDTGRQKYRIETPSGSQMKDFGRAGTKTLRIRVSERTNRIILVDETNLETLRVSLKKARRDVCYSVTLRAEKDIPHMFTYAEEGQYCEMPGPTTTATTLQPSPPPTKKTTTTSSTPPPSSTAPPPPPSSPTSPPPITTELHEDTASPSPVTPADKENHHQDDGALSRTERRDIPPLPLASTAASHRSGCSALALLFLALYLPTGIINLF